MDLNLVQTHVNLINWLMVHLQDIGLCLKVIFDLEEGKPLAQALNDALDEKTP